MSLRRVLGFGVQPLAGVTILTRNPTTAEERTMPPTTPNPGLDRMAAKAASIMRGNPGQDACAPDAMTSERDDYRYERARGLELADLDGLAKDRWRDGYDAGRDDGVRATREEFPVVYREGHEAGQHAGREDVGQRFGGRAHLGHQFALALAELEDATEAELRDGLRTIGRVLEDAIGEFNGGPGATRTEYHGEDAPLGVGDALPGIERLAPRMPEGEPAQKRHVAERMLAELKRWGRAGDPA